MCIAGAGRLLEIGHAVQTALRCENRPRFPAIRHENAARNFGRAA
jgi:hypothetical protein